MEDKEGFVRALSAALAEFGGGRYDWLRALMRDVASSDAL